MDRAVAARFGAALLFERLPQTSPQRLSEFVHWAKYRPFRISDDEWLREIEEMATIQLLKDEGYYRAKVSATYRNPVVLRWLMGRSVGKVIWAGLIWKVLGVLFSAALVVAMARFLLAQGYRKSVLIEMAWRRGDDHYGPNFIRLESACLSNPEPGCFCSLDFTTTPKELADYVESFGSHKVPVKFHVDYDRNHHVVGAILESLAEWPEERFHIRERSLATGFRMLPNHTRDGGHIRNPGDCFPQSAK